MVKSTHKRLGLFIALAFVTLAFAPLVAAAPSISLTANTRLRETSPNVAVDYTFTVKNNDVVDDNATLAVSLPSGWVASVTPPYAIIAGGASQAFTVSVTPTSYPYLGTVSVSASSENGAPVVTAFAYLRIPVVVAMTLDEEVYFPNSVVSGSVSTQYLDGNPASVSVRLTEQAMVATVPAQVLPRVKTISTDSAGQGTFELTAVGTTSPGSHRVIAEVVPTVNTNSNAISTYFVTAAGVRAADSNARTMTGSASGVAAATNGAPGTVEVSFAGAFTEVTSGPNHVVALQSFGDVVIVLGETTVTVPVNVDGTGTIVENDGIAAERWELRLSGVAPTGEDFFSNFRIVSTADGWVLAGTATARLPTDSGLVLHSLVLTGEADI